MLKLNVYMLNLSITQKYFLRILKSLIYVTSSTQWYFLLVAQIKTEIPSYLLLPKPQIFDHRVVNGLQILG